MTNFRSIAALFLALSASVTAQASAAGTFSPTLQSLENDGAGEVRHFAPENDLWREDSLEAVPNVDETLFNKVINAALEVYNPIAKQAGDRGIVVNRRWDDSTVNANVTRGLFRRVTVNMYGGLARREEVSGDGFALVLCHELGHAYGGTPYIAAFQKLSAEGQADYYGADYCLQRVLPQIPAPSSDLLSHDNGTIREKCDAEAHVGSAEHNLCVRRLSAGFGLAKLLSVMSGEAVPQYNTPDPTVVPKTLLSYPATTQCRLDTYLAGTFALAKPACWFKE
jgi:hypothetical protein